MASEKQHIGENVILVGNKHFMAYMKSMNTLFRGKNLNLIVIKARGNNIKKAVDIAESGRKKFCHDLNLKVKEIAIGTEQFTSEDKKEISVSTISIFISKI